tara:strand:+ start:146 stop:607 length:462 start_codon:yes stop_codon:yes gene_type:complete
MKKEKFLQEVNRLKGNTNLKSDKVMLSAMSELQSAIDTMNSYDIVGLTQKTLDEYEYIVGLLNEASSEARVFIQKYNDFVITTGEHWTDYQLASDLSAKISSDLYDLGIDGESFVDEFSTSLANAESEGQDAFSADQNEFPDYNKIVAITEQW